MPVSRGKKWSAFTTRTAAQVSAGSTTDYFVGLDQSGGDDLNFKMTVADMVTLLGGGGGGGGVPSTGNVLFVDGDVGNDLTGEPYATPEAARDAAVSGDLIVVYPDTYELDPEDHNLAKAGVNWHFYPGVTLRVTHELNTADNALISRVLTGIFDDSNQGLGINAALVCEITGAADLVFDVGIHNNQGNRGVVRVSNSGSNVKAEFASIDVVRPLNQYISCVAQDAGTLHLRAGRLRKRSDTYPTFWWIDGETYLDVDELINEYQAGATDPTSAFVAIFMDCTGAELYGKARVRVHRMKGVIQTVGNDNDKSLWIYFDDWEGNLVQNGGKIYFTGQKFRLTRLVEGWNIGGGLLWADILKTTLDLPSSGTALQINLLTLRRDAAAIADPETFIHFQEIEDNALGDVGGVGSNLYSAAMAVSAGEHHLVIDKFHATFPGNGTTTAGLNDAEPLVRVTGGILTFSGCLSSTDVLCRGFEVSGGSLRLRGTRVDVAGDYSIYAGSAQNVEISSPLSANKPIHTNVTLTGTLDIGAVRGTLKVRQSGGTTGDDEVQIYDDGTHGYVKSMNAVGELRLMDVNGYGIRIFKNGTQDTIHAITGSTLALGGASVISIGLWTSDMGDGAWRSANPDAYPIRFGTTAGGGTVGLIRNGSGSGTLRVNDGTSGSGALAGIIFGCYDATKIGGVCRAFASQTANMFEWQSSAEAVYGSVSENGYFTTRKNSAPADAELVAGESAYWFDSTNGAAKFMVKAKTADGTVVTGQIALA